MANINQDPTTIRILELDGGGMRGCYSLRGLARICEEFNLEGNKLNTVFDVICGTSIGGLSSLALCFGKSPDDILQIMVTNGPNIFDASLIPWIGEKKAGWSDKLLFMTGAYTSLYYNTVLQTVVNDICGTNKMSDIQGCNVLIPTVKYYGTVSSGNVFPKAAQSLILSNSTLDGLTGQDWFCSDAAMSTSAAPMYLPPWTVSGETYIDGGLAQNNMTLGGIALGRTMKPKATKVCTLSVGTGIGNMGFARDSSSVRLNNLTSGFSIVGDCISMGVTLPQEVTDFFVGMMASWNDLHYYKYRFNTEFDPAVDSELDSTSDVAIAYFKDTADFTFTRDSSEINLFMQHFQ